MSPNSLSFSLSITHSLTHSLVHTHTCILICSFTHARTRAQVIEDEPLYAFRGLMVDTARHFLPVSALLTAIEGMSIEKLNVLHWHAVDDQSFPLESTLLSRLGASGP